MDKEVIQSVGFRNIVENGEVTGFQFKVRLPYYRGVFLSQIMSGTIEVDGEKFDKDATIWNVKGEDFTVEEMKNDWHTHWDLNNPADFPRATTTSRSDSAIRRRTCRRFCRTASIPIMTQSSYFRSSAATKRPAALFSFGKSDPQI